MDEATAQSWLRGVLAETPVTIQNFNALRSQIHDHVAGMDCEHQGQLVCLKQTNGAILYYRQCVYCDAKISEWLPHKSLSAEEKANALPRVHRGDHWKIAQTLIASLGDWWGLYNAYLQTDEWREKRARAIDAAGGVCEICRRAPAVQAHHLSYENAGNEFPEDIQAICLPCHRNAHPGGDL